MDGYINCSLGMAAIEKGGPIVINNLQQDLPSPRVGMRLPVWENMNKVSVLWVDHSKGNLAGSHKKGVCW